METKEKVNILKTSALSLLIGVIGAVVGTAFSKSVQLVTQIREHNSWLLCLLCFAGLLSVLMFKLLKTDKMGTNQVIVSADENQEINEKLTPAIFVGSVLSHLFGASVGREGAALQLGGGIAAFVKRIFKLDDANGKILFYSGMAAVFSSVFLTPITAFLFALEIVCTFRINFKAVLPCVLSSLVSYALSLLLGGHPERFAVALVPEFSGILMLKILLLALCSAVLGTIFCLLLKYANTYSKKLLKNPYIRIFIGGLIITGLTTLVGNTSYNGAGMHVIFSVFEGESINNFAFAFKMLFTVVSVSVGFKGGEIVPSLFIGCTLGFALSSLLSLPVGFCAMICMVAFFATATNCPLASIALGFELFSGTGLGYIILAVIICFTVSGKTSLYSAQKRMPLKNIFSKNKSSAE